MSYMPEILIAGVFLVALITYFINKNNKDNSRKKVLLLSFREVREKSLNLQNAVTQYLMLHDSQDEKLAEDMTYGQFLKQLKKNHATHLSEKKFVKIKSSNTLLSQGKIKALIGEQNEMLSQMEKQSENAKK